PKALRELARNGGGILQVCQQTSDETAMGRWAGDDPGRASPKHRYHEQACGRHNCDGRASGPGKRPWLEKEIPQRRDYAGPSGIWPAVAMAGTGTGAGE